MATVELMHWIVATPNGLTYSRTIKRLCFSLTLSRTYPIYRRHPYERFFDWVFVSARTIKSVHIKGFENVFADLLGSWSAPACIRLIVQIMVLLSSFADEFEWPSSLLFRSNFNRPSFRTPNNLVLFGGLFENPDSTFWILEDSDKLKLRLCIIAHTAPTGHRGLKFTNSSLQLSFCLVDHHGRYSDLWPLLHVLSFDHWRGEGHIFARSFNTWYGSF